MRSLTLRPEPILVGFVDVLWSQKLCLCRLQLFRQSIITIRLRVAILVLTPVQGHGGKGGKRREALDFRIRANCKDSL